MVVVAERAIEIHDRDAPSVALLAQCDAVVGARQHLAETAQPHRPRTGRAQRLLQRTADARLADAAPPCLAVRPALIGIAAAIAVRGFGHVAIARDVDAVGAAAALISVVETGIGAHRAPPGPVIAQKAPDRIRTVGEAA